MTLYPDSIRLGLTDYMGAVERARKMIHDSEDKLFKGKNRKMWVGIKSWLHIWFNVPLLIVGFGLGVDEVFIRWLLIERKRYFRQFPERRKDTLWLGKSGDDSVPYGLLSNLNIEVREAMVYDLLYS